MESTIEYLRRKLGEVGPGEWDRIAREVTKKAPEANLTKHTLRKIFYGERPNLGTMKADALRAYFQRREGA